MTLQEPKHSQMECVECSAGQLLPWPSLKVICNVLRGAVAG